MINKRTIIFRGKSLETDEWIEGYLIEQFDIDEDPGIKCFIIELYPMFYDIKTVGRTAIEVDPETVGQYTGYDDKEETWIFEGDVIKSNYRQNAQVHVIYKLVEDIRTCNLGQHLKTDKYTVIGNIYDNPELKDMCR